ncbi:hypothetical protein PR048_003829 [Dryococelus australis]|uniref:Transposase n=1 Tax=Dryococelus australis TaxID=614101 RepID=A0ABQ9IP34_9NEOP|nr:hypothetical protein PR048_003829 [Dryococelus australis]
MPLVGGFLGGLPFPHPFIQALLYIHVSHPHRLSRPRCQQPPTSLLFTLSLASTEGVVVAALDVEVLIESRAGGGIQEIPEKTRRPAASSDMSSTMQKSGSGPTSNLARFALVGGLKPTSDVNYWLGNKHQAINRLRYTVKPQAKRNISYNTGVERSCVLRGLGMWQTAPATCALPLTHTCTAALPSHDSALQSLGPRWLSGWPSNLPPRKFALLFNPRPGVTPGFTQVGIVPDYVTGFKHEELLIFKETPSFLILSLLARWPSLILVPAAREVDVLQFAARSAGIYAAIFHMCVDSLVACRSIGERAKELNSRGAEVPARLATADISDGSAVYELLPKYSAHIGKRAGEYRETDPLVTEQQRENVDVYFSKQWRSQKFLTGRASRGRGFTMTSEWEGGKMGQILEENYLAVMTMLGAMFQRATMQWYANNNVRRLDWPAQSPDLNIIEHIWHELDRRVRARQARPKSIAPLMEQLHEEWR